jgi:hypothetical protein
VGILVCHAMCDMTMLVCSVGMMSHTAQHMHAWGGGWIYQMYLHCKCIASTALARHWVGECDACAHGC